MEKRGRASRAGGVLVALSILIGTIAGFVTHQPSIGVLAGAAVGIVLLALVWLLDRR